MKKRPSDEEQIQRMRDQYAGMAASNPSVNQPMSQEAQQYKAQQQIGGAPSYADTLAQAKAMRQGFGGMAMSAPSVGQRPMSAGEQQAMYTPGGPNQYQQAAPPITQVGPAGGGLNQYANDDEEQRRQMADNYAGMAASPSSLAAYRY